MMAAPLARLRRFAARLGRDSSAMALIEFAYCLPILITLGMYGTEMAHMATVNMQVSQIAMSVADNASRLGQTDNSALAPTITAADIDSVMFGAIKQGNSIDFQTKGRIILSSLEVDASNRQYIHWQRCRGDLAQTSAYGPADPNRTGTVITGMGRPGKVVTAPSGQAVMFVEAYYNYRGLFGTLFVGVTKFRQESAFIVRDRRDLTGVPPVGSSACT